MNGFQEQLDEEIDKRGLRAADVSESSKTVKKKALFSLPSFLKGLVVCGLFGAVVIGWVWFKSDDTMKIIQDKLASKTAIVEKDSSAIYRLGETQPVLRMPDVNLALEETPAIVKKIDSTESIKPVSMASKSKNGKELVSAPVPGLYENTSAGMLPMVRKEDSLTPFEAYKRPFVKTSDKPLLSIIFFDAGLSRKMTEGLIENFPPEVTLSLSPYSRDLKLLTDVARQNGHEVWLTLPMETKNYPLNDPGPSTLLVNASVEQNKNRLNAVLSSTQGYAGFVSQKDHVFKREDANVNPAIREIFDRGLAVLDSNPSLYSFVGDIASQHDYPNAKNNFWLDDDLTPMGLNQKIRQMIEYGESGDNLVVMLHTTPASVKALQKFLHSAAAEKFQLAPVSAQIRYGE